MPHHGRAVKAGPQNLDRQTHRHTPPRGTHPRVDTGIKSFSPELVSRSWRSASARAVSGAWAGLCWQDAVNTCHWQKTQARGRGGGPGRRWQGSRACGLRSGSLDCLIDSRTHPLRSTERQRTLRSGTGQEGEEQTPVRTRAGGEGVRPGCRVDGQCSWPYGWMRDLAKSIIAPRCSRPDPDAAALAGDSWGIASLNRLASLDRGAVSSADRA